jgi:hypothetical protein
MVPLFTILNMTIGINLFVQWMEKCWVIIMNVIKLIPILGWYGLAIILFKVTSD